MTKDFKVILILALILVGLIALNEYKAHEITTVRPHKCMYVLGDWVH